jgi:hypothetical protein
MMGRLRERLVWRLVSWTLGDDDYGRAILGDLLERQALVARASGERAAARWFRREALRSLLAFLPVLKQRPSDVIVAASIAGLAYAAAVNGVGPLAIWASDWLGIAGGRAFDSLFIVLVALAGLAGGLSTFARRRGSPSGAVTFFTLALAFGAHHLVASNAHEFRLRAVKVFTFIVFAGAGSVFALAARRTPRGVAG